MNTRSPFEPRLAICIFSSLNILCEYVWVNSRRSIRRAGSPCARTSCSSRRRTFPPPWWTPRLRGWSRWGRCWTPGISSRPRPSAASSAAWWRTRWSRAAVLRTHREKVRELSERKKREKTGTRYTLCWRTAGCMYMFVRARSLIILTSVGGGRLWSVARAVCFAALYFLLRTQVCTGRVRVFLLLVANCFAVLFFPCMNLTVLIDGIIMFWR